MESLLGETPTVRARRLIKLVWILLGLLAILLVVLISTISLCSFKSDTERTSTASQIAVNCSDEQKQNYKDMFVFRGIGYWIDELTTENKVDLVKIEAISAATRGNVSERFGEEFLVLLNNTIVTFNLKTGAFRQSWSNPAKKALFFNKTCAAPTLLENERCWYYPTENASWYEAYAKCGLVGLRISRGHPKLYNGEAWHTSLFPSTLEGKRVTEDCYRDLKSCFDQQQRIYVDSSQDGKHLVSAYDKYRYVCGEL